MKETTEDRLRRLREQFRKRAIDKEILQIPIDTFTLLKLMKIADKKAVPLYDLVRSWIMERINSEGEGQ